MIYHTQQNQHFTGRFNRFLEVKRLEPLDVFHALEKHLSFTRKQFKRICNGISSPYWWDTLAFLQHSRHFGLPLWPLHEWVWEDTLERIYAPNIPEGFPDDPELFLRNVMRYKGVYLWQLRDLIKKQRKGPVPKKLEFMFRGQVLAQGLSLIPILGMTLKVPIQPFLPKEWTGSSRILQWGSSTQGRRKRLEDPQNRPPQDQ